MIKPMHITRRARTPASGDVVLVEGAGWLSSAIRHMTTEPGEGPTRFSHVAMVLAPPIMGTRNVFTSTLIEALAGGVKVRELEAYIGKRYEVWRHYDGDLAGRAAVHALQREGQRYGYTKLALHLLDWALVRNRWRLFRRASSVDKWPICSYLVADAYSDAGFTWYDAPRGAELNPHVATPDDLADVITGSGEWWRVL